MVAAIVTNPIKFGHSALIAHPIAEKMAHTMSDKNVLRQMPDQNIRCISPAHRTVAGFVMGSIFWRTMSACTSTSGGVRGDYGTGVVVTKIIETGRLVVVVTARLVHPLLLVAVSE